MYRRIEIIAREVVSERVGRYFEVKRVRFEKVGALYEACHLMNFRTPPLFGLRRVKNLFFYFTEYGWSKHGRNILQFLLRNGHDVRVRTIKEKEMDIMWQDDVQVVLRPRKKRSDRDARREERR